MAIHSALKSDTQRQTICHPTDVAEALASPVLVPPSAPPSIGSGSIATLRASMARFSSGSDHALRRADLERAIARIDRDQLSASARKRTELRLRRAETIPRDLGFVVPTEALAIQVVRSPASLHATVAETEQIALAIGRGEPVTPDMDAACDRLLARLADHPDGPVAAASLLYQGYDSTAALFQKTMHAAKSSEPRTSAVVATTRSVTSDVMIGGCRLNAGELVKLSLEERALEFGAGIHSCPGEAIAKAIIAGMTLAFGLQAF